VPPEGQRFVVGLVRGLHGLQGGVRVEPLTDDPARFAPGSRLYPEGTPRRLTVAWSQADAPGLLVRFEEVFTREAAEGLREVYLEADSPASGGLGADEYWWHEVVGVSVTTGSGETLGTVGDVFRAGGGEVYVVRGGPRGEILIPAVRAVFREFAPREGRIVVDADALGLGPLRPRRPRGRRSSRLGASGSAPELDTSRPGGPENVGPRDATAGPDGEQPAAGADGGHGAAGAQGERPAADRNGEKPVARPPG
jgi:16S rRNA processing protein RimM